MVDQGEGVCACAMLDSADENNMIAFFVATVIGALKPCCARQVEFGGTVGRMRERHTLKTFGCCTACETLRNGHLLRTQHVNHVALALLKSFERRRVSRQAPDHQRRIERDGVKRADRQPNRGHAICGCSDYGYTCWKSAERRSEKRRIKRRGGCVHVRVRYVRSSMSRRQSVDTSDDRAGARGDPAKTQSIQASVDSPPSVVGGVACCRRIFL